MGADILPTDLFAKRRVAIAAASGLTLAAASGAAAVAVAETASEPTPAAETAIGCELEELPTPDDSVASSAMGLSAAGDIAVGRATPAGPLDDTVPHVLLWEDGDYDELDLPGESQQLVAVNSSGMAVGHVWMQDHAAAAVYDDGEAWQLPGVEAGYAADVNDYGAIVGHTVDQGRTPLLWPDADSDPVELELPDGAEGGEATAIDSDGTVAGYYTDADENAVFYTWSPDGDGAELALPADVEPGEDAVVTGMSDGWIVGMTWQSPDDEDSASLRWDPETGEPEILELSRVHDVNPQGWAAGSTDDEAALIADDALVTLPGLIDETGDVVDAAQAVSDDGSTVVGTSVFDPDEGDAIAAVQWNCQ